MTTIKTNINSNPNVGLFGYATNEYCLLGLEVHEEQAEEIGKALKVPVHRLTICGTSLIGVFLAGNNETLLVPEIAFDHEIAKLKELGIKYTIIPAKATAFGNNIICNDNGAYVSTEFSDSEIRTISNALKVPTEKGMIAELETVGSVTIMNTKGCLIHRDIEDSEKKIIEKLLGIECTPTTVNMGSPYVNSGVLCNDNGIIIGDMSGGPELVEAEEGLKMLE